MPNQNLLRVALVVIAGGILLIGFTYLFEFLLPLIAVAAVLIVAYLIYVWHKTGNIEF